MAMNTIVGVAARQVDAAHPNSYPKTCQPGADCIASTWLLVGEVPVYLILGVWLLGLLAVPTYRATGALRRH